MPKPIYLLLLLAIAVFGYQVFVSMRVASAASFSTKQKGIQIILVWLIPGLGAALVHAFLTADGEKMCPRDPNFIPNAAADGGGDGALH